MKTKPQWEMGKRFRCSIPSPIEPSDDDSHSVLDNSFCESQSSDVPIDDALSPPRKSARGFPKRHAITRQPPASPPGVVLRSRISSNSVGTASCQ